MRMGRGFTASLLRGFVSEAAVTDVLGAAARRTLRERLAKGKEWVVSTHSQVSPPNFLPPPAAPRRPPGNISWTFSSSSLSVKWDPVVPLRNESAVTGYKVGRDRPSTGWWGRLVCIRREHRGLCFVAEGTCVRCKRRYTNGSPGNLEWPL